MEAAQTIDLDTINSMSFLVCPGLMKKIRNNIFLFFLSFFFADSLGTDFFTDLFQEIGNRLLSLVSRKTASYRYQPLFFLLLVAQMVLVGGAVVLGL